MFDCTGDCTGDFFQRGMKPHQPGGKVLSDFLSHRLGLLHCYFSGGVKNWVIVEARCVSFSSGIAA